MHVSNLFKITEKKRAYGLIIDSIFLFVNFVWLTCNNDKCQGFFSEGGPCRVGSVGSVSASRTVGREFASRPGHTKDHHKNDTMR